MASTNAGKALAAATTNVKLSPGSNAGPSVSGDKMPLFIVIGVTVLLFVAVILYITFRMKGGNLSGRALTSLPIRLDTIETPVEVAAADIPKPTVGREYTYTFWLYLEEFVPDYNPTGKHAWHKMVFYRGNAGDVSTANPIVMMDGQSNKLYIVIKTEGSKLSTKFGTNANINTNLHEIIDNNYFLNKSKRINDPDVNKHIIMGIDYIPLQRWVHVGIVVDNKLATVYVDGEIYSVKSVDEFKGTRAPEQNLGKTIDYNLIIDRSEANVYIGKGVVGDKKAPNGFLGKLEYFNYALGSDDIKKVYSTGPIKGGLLSMFGMSQYGVRAPIYKVSDTIE